MIGFNGSNYTNDWMTLWTQPYIHVFGDLFFAIVFMIIGAGVYIGSDKNPLLTAIYFLVCAVMFGPIFNLWVSTVVLIIPGMIFASIAYNALIEKKPRF